MAFSMQPYFQNSLTYSFPCLIIILSIAALLTITYNHQHTKQGNGYRWPHIALGRLVKSLFGQRPRRGRWPMIPHRAIFSSFRSLSVWRPNLLTNEPGQMKVWETYFGRSDLGSYQAGFRAGEAKFWIWEAWLGVWKAYIGVWQASFWIWGLLWDLRGLIWGLTGPI